MSQRPQHEPFQDGAKAEAANHEGELSGETAMETTPYTGQSLFVVR